MGFSEDITKLRIRLNDLISLNVIDHKNFRSFYQTTLLEIIIEVERKKRDIDKVINNLKHQISKEEGRLMSFDQAHALIYAIVDNFCRKQENMLEEEKSREAEASERAAYVAKMAKDLDEAAEKIRSESSHAHNSENIDIVPESVSENKEK